MEKLNLEEFGKRIIYLREIHGKSQEERSYATNLKQI